VTFRPTAGGPAERDRDYPKVAIPHRLLDNPLRRTAQPCADGPVGSQERSDARQRTAVGAAVDVRTMRVAAVRTERDRGSPPASSSRRTRVAIAP
jgi:hypothetical protein